MNTVQSPFPQFFDTDGAPLSGLVYVGVTGQNPETAPISVYWDDAATQPAAQPLRVSGGYVVRSGNIASVYLSQDDYSLTCKTASGKLIFYAPDVTSLSTLRADLSNYVDGKGASLVHTLQVGSATDQTVRDKLNRAKLDPEDFGASSGATDNSAALLAALATGKKVTINEGTWNLTRTPVSGVAFSLSGGQVLQGAGRRAGASCSTLNVNTSSYAAGDAFLQPTSANQVKNLRLVASSATEGIGFKLSQINTFTFAGRHEIKELEAYGFNTGFSIGNVFDSDISGLIANYCKYGVTINPPNDAGDNGYLTTLNIDNLKAEFNTDYGLYVYSPLTSKTITFRKLIVQGNCSATGTYQSYFENISAKLDTFYFEGAPTKYAAKIVTSNLILENGYLNGTGGISTGSTGCNLRLFQVVGTGENDGIISTGGGNNQHYYIEGCTLNGCVFAAGNVLTIVDSTINGVYYGFYTTLDFNASEWSGTAPEGSALGSLRSYTTTITDTVNANSSKVIVADHDMGSAIWAAGVTAVSNFANGYFPGLILQTTCASTGSANYFSVIATNTTGSNITITSKVLSTLITRMATSTAY